MPQVIKEAKSALKRVTRFNYDLELLRSHPTGKGGTSDVWEGNVQRGKDVFSIKLPRPGKYGEEMSPLEREAIIWSFLENPNICPFHGIYYVDDRPALIAPWYRNGSANVYLKNRPSANATSIIHEITQGVAYLHSRGIVHGDLKGDNVMIDDDGHARIIDFGQSRVLTPDLPDVGPTTATYSIRWCAPELHPQPTYASDVYSWACTVLELLTGNVPYADFKDVYVYQNKSIPPSVSVDAFKYEVKDPNSLCQLLERCWGVENTRPGIEEIKNLLQRLL